MLASIIINNYNYGSYVAQAIDSAFNQTYSPIEIIVVDDGSTDNSRDVISSYQDKVKVIFQPNSGQNAACNAGWRECRGDIVIFLDSDDILLPECVSKCVAGLAAPDKIKVQYLLRKVDKNLKPLGGVMPSYGIGDETDVLRDMNSWGYYLTPPNSGNAYKRHFLEKVMPMPEFLDESGVYYSAIDGLLAGVAGLFGGIVSIKEILGLYRMHGANKSDAGKVDSIAKLRRLFMRDRIREEFQISWAKKLGKPYDSDLSLFHPNVCKQRFLAYRILPQGHPVPEDSYWKILFSGLYGALRFPYITARKRIFIFFGFIAIGILPAKILSRMIGAVTKPDTRRGMLAPFNDHNNIFKVYEK